jgi:hypothetical protein
MILEIARDVSTNQSLAAMIDIGLIGLLCRWGGLDQAGDGAEGEVL